MSQPPPAQITIKPPLAFRMMYPYMMNQSMGQSMGQSLGQGMGPGMGQGYPGMPMPMEFNQMMGTPSSATPYLPQEGELKAFDSSQMKRGRNGHYGYLEGRELAGPPVGFLPAGMQPQRQTIPSTPSAFLAAQPPTAYQPTTYAPTAAAAAHTHAPSVGSGAQRSAWGDQSIAPLARYDGSAAARYVQADMDTPYPRDGSGGMTSSRTRWGPDNEIINGIEGRMGIGHRRQREGRV